MAAEATGVDREAGAGVGLAGAGLDEAGLEEDVGFLVVLATAEELSSTRRFLLLPAR